MAMTKPNYAAIDRWKHEKTDRIQVSSRKEDRLPERIEAAVAAGKAKSRQAYIIAAVKAALERDGIPEIKDGV